MWRTATGKLSSPFPGVYFHRLLRSKRPQGKTRRFCVFMLLYQRGVHFPDCITERRKHVHDPLAGTRNTHVWLCIDFKVVLQWIKCHFMLFEIFMISCLFVRVVGWCKINLALQFSIYRMGSVIVLPEQLCIVNIICDFIGCDRFVVCVYR